MHSSTRPANWRSPSTLQHWCTGTTSMGSPLCKYFDYAVLPMQVVADANELLCLQCRTQLSGHTHLAHPAASPSAAEQVVAAVVVVAAAVAVVAAAAAVAGAWHSCSTWPLTHRPRAHIQPAKQTQSAKNATSTTSILACDIVRGACVLGGELLGDCCHTEPCVGLQVHML